MNQKQRTAYWSIHKRRMEAFEKMFVPQVFKAMRPQIDQFIEILKRDGIDQARRWLHKQVMTPELMPVLEEMYKTVGAYFAGQTIREINHSARERNTSSQKSADIAGSTFPSQIEYKRFGINAQWFQSIINYFKQYLLDMVFNIAETTKRQIFDLLKTAEDEGWGVDKIALKMESPELTLWRSRLIVRTESVKAMRYGNDLAAGKSIWVTEKIWIAAHDHRTRHSHRTVDGEVTRGKFRVERWKGGIFIGFDMMDGPGDRTASIENIANCRCSDARRPVRDERGRLIRKQENQLAV